MYCTHVLLGAAQLRALVLGTGFLAALKEIPPFSAHQPLKWSPNPSNIYDTDATQLLLQTRSSGIR